MKKYILLFLLLPLLTFSQKMVSREVMEIKKFQKNLDAEYLDPKQTPLRGDNFKNFKGHPFFPFDLKYRVTAKFVKTKDAQPFELPTSSGKTKSYKEYGKATFELDGKAYTLTLYQSLDLIKQDKYKDYLFCHSVMLPMKRKPMAVGNIWI